MKHYEEVQVPAKTEQRLVKTTCDLCGDEIKDERYKVDEVTVSHRTGEQYPEGGLGTETNVDMCGQCFEGKLVPWLKSQGVVAQVTEWDW